MNLNFFHSRSAISSRFVVLVVFLVCCYCLDPPVLVRNLAVAFSAVHPKIWTASLVLRFRFSFSLSSRALQTTALRERFSFAHRSRLSSDFRSSATVTAASDRHGPPDHCELGAAANEQTAHSFIPSVALTRTGTMMARPPTAAMGALLPFLIALLALGGTVQPVAAVPFSSLSPPPDLRLVKTGSGSTFCVLSASGRDVSSIAVADLLTYMGGVCSGGMAVNAVDLR